MLAFPLYGLSLEKSSCSLASEQLVIVVVIVSVDAQSNSCAVQTRLIAFVLGLVV